MLEWNSKHKKKNPNRKRGDLKQHRCDPTKKKRDNTTISIFFGNTTYASEKAKTYLLERNDDMVLLAEHHLDKSGTIKLMNFFSKNKWMTTASPARPTERSENGTTAGVLVGIKNFLDNRAVSFATDPEGRLTSNAQLTGRCVTLSWVEVLILAGYLEGGIGFAGSNFLFLSDLEYATRGGRTPFILCIDANVPPDEWAAAPWGDTDFLDHMKAEIVMVRNSNIACTGARNIEGGSNIDYVIMSKVLLGGVEDCAADFEVLFAPHVGIVLKMAMDPKVVYTRVLQKPDMPQGICKLDNKKFEEHRFQDKSKPNNIIEQLKETP